MGQDMDDSRGATTIGLQRLDSHEVDEESILETTDINPLLETSEPRFHSQDGLASTRKHRLSPGIGSIWEKITPRIAWSTGGIILALVLIAIGVPKLTSHQGAAVPELTPVSSIHWKGFDKIDNYFAFGDSWTSTKYYAAGPQPNEANPLGNPDWPGLPSSMGPNYVAYLTGLYNQSFIKTWDFAWPGSVVDTHNDPLFLDWLDFPHQLKDEFIKYHTLNESGALSPKGWASDNTLFTIFFGINDVVLFNRENSHLDKTYASYEGFMERIYNASGRNFVVMNVPPLQHAPNFQRAPDKKRIGADGDVALFNDMLARLVKDLRDRHDDITIFLFDVYNLFDRMVQNPAAFPQTAIYKDVMHDCEQYAKHLEDMKHPTMTQVEACGGLEVQEYLWRDGLHVTYPVHKLLAAGIAQMLKSNGTSLL